MENESLGHPGGLPVQAPSPSGLGHSAGIPDAEGLMKVADLEWGIFYRFYLKHKRPPTSREDGRELLVEIAKWSPIKMTEAGWCSLGFYPPIEPAKE